MSISIFAKNPSRAQSDRHLQRVSSIIRAQQIAKHIGAKLNPGTGFEEDVCIYVKPHVKPHEDFVFAKRAYLDIIDGWVLLHLIQRHPKVTVITCSYNDFEYISNEVSNRVILIPQHHCNYERKVRDRNGITTVGVIGAAAAFSFLPAELKEKLSDRSIELIEFSSFQTREDICNFYQKIDVQIVWRPYMRKQKIRLSNPLKIVNAASFGVPTIALDEPAFHEMSGCYVPVTSLEGFLKELDSLRDSESRYRTYSQRCLAKAETYHIDKVSALYRALT